MFKELAEPHGPHRAVWRGYWTGGRMRLEQVGAGPCGCPADHDVKEVRVDLVLTEGADAGVPGTDLAWVATSAAPDAEGAVEMAREAAKALTFRRNPLFLE